MASRLLRTRLVAASILTTLWGSGCGDDDVIYPTGALPTFDAGASSEETHTDGSGETSTADTALPEESSERTSVVPTTAASSAGQPTSSDTPANASDTAEGETSAVVSSDTPTWADTSAPVAQSDGGVTQVDPTTDGPAATLGLSDASVDAGEHLDTAEPVDTQTPVDTHAPVDTDPPTNVGDASIETETLPKLDGGGVVWPNLDASEPNGSGGEPIPDDLVPVTEFDSPMGYIGVYNTTNAFEEIVPEVNDGVAQFSIPFASPDDRLQWVLNLEPAPQDLSFATLVVRARVVSGFTNNPELPGVIQLYANNGAPDFGGAANWSSLPPDDAWATFEFPLDVTGWNYYTPTAVTSVAFEFHPNWYAASTADVIPAVVEVDWVGIRVAALPPSSDAGM